MFSKHRINGAAIFLTVVFTLCLHGCSKDSNENEESRVKSPVSESALSSKHDDNTTKIIRSVSYEKAAKKKFERGQYADAIAKYRQAILPENINYEWEESLARGMIRKIYLLQEQYDSALNELLWIKDKNPKEYHRLKEEISVRLHYFKTGEKFPVLEYVEQRLRDHKDYLPPIGYGASGYSDILASEFIQLYDYAGAVDEGLEFVERILDYPKLNKNARAEYLKIKQAFEQDKAEGTKGRPTQVLIQSKYLTW